MAQDSVLSVEVVSRYGGVGWQGQAQRASVPLVDGELGILPGREPVLALLGRGRVRIVGLDGQEVCVEVEDGFCSVDRDVVTVAADRMNEEIGRAGASQVAELEVAALTAADDEDLD